MQDVTARYVTAVGLHCTIETKEIWQPPERTYSLFKHCNGLSNEL